MADENKIGLQAVFENEQFQKGIEEYNSSIDKASSNTDVAGSDMSYVWEGLASVGQIAFTAIVAGIAAISAELYIATQAAMDTEEVLARMEFVVGNTAERTGIASETVLKLADNISKVKPFDDEVVASAITMGLTFDGVTKDNIEPLISAAADLATWTGRDLPSTMKSLAMSISDPDKAMRLLREANITLTDAELKTFKGFKDTGDAAGATTFLLEQLKKKGIIGLADAMGKTSKGQLTIMKTGLGNLQEALGAGLLTSLNGLIQKLTDFANDPKVINFMTELGVRIGNMASEIISKLPAIITVIEGVMGWLSENKPLIIGVLAAIGVALIAFAATTVAAAASSIAALAPIIAVMAVVGLAIGLLYKAWTENWGGVQQKVAAAWKQIKPVFDQLQKWMKDNLPKAIKVLSDFWEKTLLPAIKTVFTWIVDKVLPVLVELVLWLGDNVPKAIKETSDFFTKTLIPAIKSVADWFNNTLVPALTTVWNWLSNLLTGAVSVLVGIFNNVLVPAIQFLAGIWNNVLVPAMMAVYNVLSATIFPVFNALANLLNSVVTVAVRALAGLWQNVLQPAIQSVGNIIYNNVMPAFNAIASIFQGALKTATQALADLWRNVLSPAIQWVWDKLEPFRQFLAGAFLSAWNGIKSAVQWVVDRLDDLADAIDNLVLPDWLTPGSPTPFEMGLRGINAELEKLSRSSLPAIQHQLNVTGNIRDVAGSSTQPTSSSISNSSQSTRNYIYGANFSVNGQSGMIEALQSLG